MYPASARGTLLRSQGASRRADLASGVGRGHDGDRGCNRACVGAGPGLAGHLQRAIRSRAALQQHARPTLLLRASLANRTWMCWAPIGTSQPPTAKPLHCQMKQPMSLAHHRDMNETVRARNSLQVHMAAGVQVAAADKPFRCRGRPRHCQPEAAHNDTRAVHHRSRQRVEGCTLHAP